MNSAIHHVVEVEDTKGPRDESQLVVADNDFPGGLLIKQEFDILSNSQYRAGPCDKDGGCAQDQPHGEGLQ